MRYWFLLLLSLSFLIACKKDATPPMVPVSAVEKFLTLGAEPADYFYEVPAEQKWNIDSFTVNNEKAELGRVLFYDKNMSKDGMISCASCHKQDLAFADDAAISTGVFGRMGTRNAMALGNFTSFSSFLGLHQNGISDIPIFWDSRTRNIADQIEQAITNPDEMGLTMEEAVTLVEAQPYYPVLFERAFGDSLITKSAIKESLLHFMASLHSFSSKFDAELASSTDKHVDFAGFTAAENQGKAIYLQHCDLCHGSLDTKQIVFEANNGLDSVFTDLGIGAITGLFYTDGVFKVPALRNIELSGPFMHDGRFADLDEVIEHYSTGVKRTFSLHGDLLSQVGVGQYEAKNLELNEADKAALKAFLLTLTDENLVRDERFSNPFR